jgi:hypothetical protein
MYYVDTNPYFTVPHTLDLFALPPPLVYNHAEHHHQPPVVSTICGTRGRSHGKTSSHSPGSVQHRDGI